MGGKDGICRARHETGASDASDCGQNGPPFLTDDPGMPDYRHSEGYIFSTYAKAPDGKEIAAPAFEYNYSAGHDLMLHSVTPFLDERPTDGPRVFGWATSSSA